MVPPVVKIRSFSMVTPVLRASIVAERGGERVAVDGYAEEQEPGTVAAAAYPRAHVHGAEYGIGSHEQADTVLQAAGGDPLAVLPDVAAVQPGAEIHALAEAA